MGRRCSVATARSSGSPAVEVTDTTGAGDAFVGGFGYGIARGLDQLEAVGSASAASDSVRRPGTQRSFPRDVQP